MGEIQRILLTPEVVTNSYELFGGVGWLDSSKPFDFGDDPNRDPDPGIFTAVG